MLDDPGAISAPLLRPAPRASISASRTSKVRELDRLTIGEEFAAMRQDTITPEGQARTYCGWRIHFLTFQERVISED